jgi:hypothetical protein
MLVSLYWIDFTSELFQMINLFAFSDYLKVLASSIFPKAKGWIVIIHRVLLIHTQTPQDLSSLEQSGMFTVGTVQIVQSPAPSTAHTHITHDCLPLQIWPENFQVRLCPGAWSKTEF